MPSISSIAAQTLQRRIVSGEFAQGDTLPAQRELAESLNISRASLREAISMLEALGLVRSQAGKGVFVTWGRKSDPEQLPAGPAAVPPHALFEFRHALEPAWAGLAAQRATAAEHAALRTIQAGMEAALAAGDLVQASELDLQFHLRLADLSGNPLLRAAAGQFSAQIAHSLRLPFADVGGMWAPADEHRHILAAIEAGDGAAAAAAMRAHLDAAAARVGIDFLRPDTSLPSPSSTKEPSHA
ncbi:FadR/GntR family transcriptional regulator [Pseudothauera rhizosphaerae]|uniref:FadR family transcriptional regulator n=1 Tax=Pseudothauera rhizosphaerae TaxID=2565932 RepID=A0A4S4ATU0_9RHOO|nr:FCD domain-containing protein [Pseudothauera rhizosphaerae]THF63331.1 FadR family transcriptional regulator [Pseudothauera rhizosphaerae]